MTYDPSNDKMLTTDIRETLPKSDKGYHIYPDPPKAELVLQFAQALAADPTIKAIFDRMDKWGLPTAEELDQLDAFRDEWLQANNMQRLNLNGFFGAYMVFRRIAWGQIDSLGDPKAMRFLKEDEPRNHLGAWTGGTVKNRIDESMWMANYVRLRCGFWPLLQEDYKHRGENGWNFKGSEAYTGFWYVYYGPVFGVVNRSMRGNASEVLEEWTMGRVPSLESKAAWEVLNDQYPIIGDHFVENLNV